MHWKKTDIQADKLLILTRFCPNQHPWSCTALLTVYVRTAYSIHIDIRSRSLVQY